MTVDATWSRQLTEARLLVSPPEEVARELALYGEAIRRDPWTNRNGDMEFALFAREDPLIALALAGNACSTEIIGALFRRAHAKDRDPVREPYWRGLRIACVANPGVCPATWITREEASEYLRHAEMSECDAFISNPKFESGYLKALYRGTAPFDKLQEERWAEFVHLSHKNPRLFEDRTDHENPDLEIGQIHEAIFQLLGKAPLTNQWLLALIQLVACLDPAVVYSPEDIGQVLKRWEGFKPDSESGPPPAGWLTDLPMHREFRCVVAAQYGRTLDRAKRNWKTHGDPNSHDEALRCAHYANADFTAEEAQSYLAKDHGVFSLGFLLHKHALHDRKLRAFMEESCVHRDNRWLYVRRCEQTHRARPSFDPRPLAELLRDEQALAERSRGSVTKDDIQRVNDALTSLKQEVTAVANGLTRLRAMVLGGLVLLGAVLLWWGR